MKKIYGSLWYSLALIILVMFPYEIFSLFTSYEGARANTLVMFTQLLIILFLILTILLVYLMIQRKAKVKNISKGISYIFLYIMCLIVVGINIMFAQGQINGVLFDYNAYMGEPAGVEIIKRDSGNLRFSRDGLGVDIIDVKEGIEFHSVDREDKFRCYKYTRKNNEYIGSRGEEYPKDKCNKLYEELTNNLTTKQTKIFNAITSEEAGLYLEENDLLDESIAYI